VLERVDPILSEHRYSVIPVRIIIDTEGKVKYIHFLRAFPEQEKAITAALKQWKFRPYEQDGKRFEVETGLTFGRISRPVLPPDPDTSRATD
jgi:Gram-negative bacterial TonB protein C-terminal